VSDTDVAGSGATVQAPATKAPAGAPGDGIVVVPDPPAGSSRRRLTVGLVAAAVAVALAVPPFYLDQFWLQVGLFAMAASVGALGLNLLVGVAGQLSLAHSFFIAVGAYGYTCLASQPDAAGHIGVGLPPLVAAVLAVALAGAAGLAFSPIASRLRGIYLGVASLGLVFLGQHVLFNAESLTGGFGGRQVPPFAIGGFAFDAVPGERLQILGVPLGRSEKLWFLGAAVLVAALAYFLAVRRTRPGLALKAVRGGEVPAAVMGVDVTAVKLRAFVVSSMYAGVAGVLLALSYRRIVPETFGLTLAIEYLAMIVLGGLGSGFGTLAGAFVVASIPAILGRYSNSLPLIAQPGSGGITAGIASRLIYGTAIVVILLFEPRGLAGLGAALTGARRRRPPRVPPTAEPAGAPAFPSPSEE
jgi:branched-chain amino acid transport system permease protein